MTETEWERLLKDQLKRFPDQFDQYCEIKKSNIAGEGVHGKVRVPPGIHMGITHIYTGFQSAEEIPDVFGKYGFTPATYGPPKLWYPWLRSQFGHKLNAPQHLSQINIKSLHFDRNGDSLDSRVRMKKPRIGDIKVTFVLKTIPSPKELLGGYTIGYNPATAAA